jgi:hypothetical protein
MMVIPKFGARSLKCVKYNGQYEQAQKCTFKMKITWWSAGALEFKCLTVKSRVKYTIKSEIIINQDIVDEATKYYVI